MRIIFCLTSVFVFFCLVLFGAACDGCSGDESNNPNAVDDDSTATLDDDSNVDDDDNDDVDDDNGDLTEMVLIPAGSFQMGCEPEDGECDLDEYPRHEVYLSDYYLDMVEVTNERYAEFVNDHGNVCDGVPCIRSAHPLYLGLYESEEAWLVDPGYKSRPVIFVTYYGAKDFCEWAGGRLPTEAEWEKAAKGATEHFIYPWGDTDIVNAANTWESDDPFEKGNYPWTTPIGYYDGGDNGGAYQTSDGRSPYGLYDMAGNAWEWVSDWYDEDYYSYSPATDPQGPETGTLRVAKGGCWMYYDTNIRRASIRGWFRDNLTNLLNGVRCAQDAE
jgi:formylglycine-generating enzyme required for sulfatase activity